MLQFQHQFFQLDMFQNNFKKLFDAKDVITMGQAFLVSVDMT